MPMILASGSPMTMPTRVKRKISRKIFRSASAGRRVGDEEIDNIATIEFNHPSRKEWI